MCSILKELKLVRQKGSHAFYRHNDGRSTVIPIHKGDDLGRGLIRSVLKDIEISVEEYERLRK
ncbi:MAG: type II toxin-antitoxin system HicA family toxin [bacterium]